MNQQPPLDHMKHKMVTKAKSRMYWGFFTSRDIHDVMTLCDRASAMKNGKLVGTVDVDSVTDDDLLSMTILGKYPHQKEI
jgi:D-xylose transport system ATP-binding protein